MPGRSGGQEGLEDGAGVAGVAHRARGGGPPRRRLLGPAVGRLGHHGAGRRRVDLGVGLQAPDRQLAPAEGVDRALGGGGQHAKVGVAAGHDLVVVHAVGREAAGREHGVGDADRDVAPADLGGGAAAHAPGAAECRGDGLVAPAAAQDVGAAPDRPGQPGQLGLGPRRRVEDRGLGAGDQDVAVGAGVGQRAAAGDVDDLDVAAEDATPVLGGAVEAAVEGVVEQQQRGRARAAAQRGGPGLSRLGAHRRARRGGAALRDATCLPVQARRSSALAVVRACRCRPLAVVRACRCRPLAVVRACRCRPLAVVRACCCRPLAVVGA